MANPSGIFAYHFHNGWRNGFSRVNTKQINNDWTVTLASSGFSTCSIATRTKQALTTVLVLPEQQSRPAQFLSRFIWCRLTHELKIQLPFFFYFARHCLGILDYLTRSLRYYKFQCLIIKFLNKIILFMNRSFYLLSQTHCSSAAAKKVALLPSTIFYFIPHSSL